MYYWLYIDVMFGLNKILYGCRIIRLLRCFGGTCCFHLQGDWIKFRWVWSDWEKDVDIYISIPYIRSIYLVCIYVYMCTNFTRIVANNCYGKEKGKGSRFIGLQYLCPHTFFWSRKFHIKPCHISQVEVLLFKTRKLLLYSVRLTFFSWRWTLCARSKRWTDSARL